MSFRPEATAWTGGDDGGFNANDNAGGWETSRASGDARNDDAAEGNDGPKLMGECFNCGQVGHNKAECMNEKVDRPFTGTCHICEQEGHRAADCPDKPVIVCRLCNLEGHRASDCIAARTNVFPTDTPILTTAEAWDKIKTADAEHDLDELKSATFAYFNALKVEGTLTSTDLADLEQGFREEKRNAHLIAREQKGLAENLTIVDITGQIGQKYVLTFAWSAKPRNKMLAEGWPEDAAANMERLKSCGLVVDRGVPLCNNCGKAGHTKKRCPEEAVIIEQITITCTRCSAVGHRVRDCPEQPVDRNACRNCKQSGHMAADCTEPRSAEGVECKNCGNMGHFARDCPDKKERAPRTCRNCDDPDHISKDCPKPRDWSRVQCKNCDQFGHTHVKCKMPPKEVDGADETNGNADVSGQGAKASTEVGVVWGGNTDPYGSKGDGW